MQTGKRRQYDESCKRYLDEVAHAYIVDGTSSLYKPKTETTQHDTNQDSQRSHKTRTLRVDIIRDLPFFSVSIINLLVSIGTLLLLVVTVYYAHKQWIEANRSAAASEKAANAAASAATVAKNSLDLTREEFASRKLPYCSLMSRFELMDSALMFKSTS